jgi:hypothetical protein
MARRAWIFQPSSDLIVQILPPLSLRIAFLLGSALVGRYGRDCGSPATRSSEMAGIAAIR